MTELFEAGDAYLEELEKLRSEMKRKAILKSAREFEEEREDGRRKRPFHVTQPWL